MCSSPHVLAVHPLGRRERRQRVHCVGEGEPGQIELRVGGAGTPAHLAGELFKLAFGVDITHVPFTGGGPAMTATLGGHTSCVVSALPTGAPYARAGNVRALALMGARRSPLLPDVPTMAEATGIGLEADIVTGLVAPAGTPKEVVSLLHRAIANIVAPPEFNDRLLALSFDPVASAPDQFAHWIKIEIAKWVRSFATPASPCSDTFTMA